MRGAISNIAWEPHEEPMAAALMQEYGVAGVEVAPTKIAPRPLELTPEELRRYRRFWEERGIAVVALQSLLFGRPDLTLFDGAEARRATAEYLRGMIRLGAELGAGALVFGSPKNRLRGPVLFADAAAVAVEFFGELGAYAAEHGCALCIEPNPAQYGCDFVSRSDEACALVRAVGSPGFGLHLDAASLLLAGEDPAEAVLACAAELRHFHASEPLLGPVGAGGVDHGAMAEALRVGGYRGWVSVEMRRPAGDPEGALREALETLRGRYLSGR